ncbi:Translocator protein [Acipenser ruthenus]|uniref:Translocator protein n=1 Tax=Acipenser ruthenus TaxID=7906 RepID=A0A444V250_ACIRT|nr:Translocator protein [Acipenser ruthenus]
MWTHILGFTALPHVGGIVGSLYTRTEVSTWYKTLKKPAWHPPNRVFPIAWTTLYTSMGYGSYLIWKDMGGFTSAAAVPLGLYGAQLALNWAWTPIFFGAHNLKLALVEIVILSGTVAATMVSWTEVSTWYKTLKKPAWRPPNRVFPIAWTTLYTSMGYGSYLIWKDMGGFTSAAAVPLGLYGAQLALNWAWTPIFFGAHNLKLVRQITYFI